MQKRRLISFILILMLLFSYSGMTVQAANTNLPNEQQNATTKVIHRASGGFSVSVPANTLITADSTFPLEIGETITINAHYTPTTASVDFGFIAPDGLFYPVSASNGYINVTIEVTQHGYYRFGIKNKSSYSISAFGIVTY